MYIIPWLYLFWKEFCAKLSVCIVNCRGRPAAVLRLYHSYRALARTNDAMHGLTAVLWQISLSFFEFPFPSLKPYALNRKRISIDNLISEILLSNWRYISVAGMIFMPLSWSIGKVSCFLSDYWKLEIKPCGLGSRTRDVCS